jgi:hypothetical protein
LLNNYICVVRSAIAAFQEEKSFVCSCHCHAWLKGILLFATSVLLFFTSSGSYACTYAAPPSDQPTDGPPVFDLISLCLSHTMAN